jgi:HpcH/HpaI aldolase/citrate lyase family
MRHSEVRQEISSFMRSKLFVPGSRPELFEKAWRTDADALSFDLEDAVPIGSKSRAREFVAEALNSAPRPRSKIAIVRVNGLDGPDFEEDIQAVVRPGLDVINLPKIEDAEAVRGHCRIFPKEHAKGTSAIGHVLPLPKPLIFSFGGLGSGLAEQVTRDVDQREPSSFFGQFGGVGLDEYFDGFVTGMNFDTQRAAFEIDFVTPSRFTANNCVGHLRSYERLKG